MKLFRMYIATFCLMIAFISNAQSGNNTLNTTVTFHADSISKSNLLDSLASKYQLHFSYNPDLMNAGEKVSINWVGRPLFEVLGKLVDKTVIDFKALDNQIIFFPVNPEVSAQLVVPFKIITGKVIEERKGKPIPYCNIGVLGKAMGTMTNANGEFIVKIPEQFWTDTLIFSCMGFESKIFRVDELLVEANTVQLPKKTFQLLTVNVLSFDPEKVLENVEDNLEKNYNDEYALFTTFYREIILENDSYSDISEAVLQVMKAPYSRESKRDHVKLLKGRKGVGSISFSDIRFKLKGGPYYITKLDLVKNKESFINPEFRHLYEYKFEQVVTVNNRKAAVLSFSPIYNLRDILYKGKLFVDIETWAISRIDFEYTKPALREARNSLIHKEPRNCKAIPTNLEYSIQYKMVEGKWYFYSAQSVMDVKINNREKKERTRFQSIAEILTTNIERGKFQHFTNQEIFRSNEIFTDKIVEYDNNFWMNYNIIRPEEELTNALKNFDNQNLVITNL